MKKGIFLAVCLVFLIFGLCLAQPEPTTLQAAPEVATPEPAPETSVPEEAQTQWVWGEVVSVDAAAKTVVVKYLDYETDQEKEITLEVAADATFENVSSLAQIMPKDPVSVDYIVSPEGKNIAKNISVEKAEPAPETEEAMPKEPESAEPTQE